MQLLLDNLLATVLGTMVLLILATLRVGQMDQSVERIRLYAAKQQQDQFRTTLTADMHNLVVLESVSSATDSTFSFQAIVEPAQDLNPAKVARVTYRIRHTETSKDVVNGALTTVRLYSILREVRPGSAAAAAKVLGVAFTGTSTAPLVVSAKAVRFTAENADVQVVAQTSDARQVRVQVSLMSHFQGMRNRRGFRDVSFVQWDARYRPRYLGDHLL